MSTIRLMISGQDALDRAIAAQEPIRARRVAQTLVASHGDEYLINYLGRCAVDSSLALDLLLEHLERAKTLHRMARGALLDEAAIDDVAQDALISIASAITGFTGRSKFTTWTHRIVRNRVADHLRRQRATAPLPDDAQSPTVRMSSMIAMRTTLQDALGELPEHYRRPVTLRDVHGLTYVQIAERLQLSTGTVKSQVARGRAMVAATIG